MDKIKTIAILGGTGKEGQGLALRWANAGYQVIIGSRQQEKAQAVAEEINRKLGINTTVGLTNELAAKQADVCILTVTQTAHVEALISLKDFLKGKILVDATARVDYQEPKPPASPSAARIAQEILGKDVQVVAAFQNIPANALRKNLDKILETDVLVCSDDYQAALVVIELSKTGGMRAFFAGNLDQAIVVEGLTSILITLNQHYGIKTASLKITGID
jgi:NADPH-dependent F420 reductase